MMTVIKITLPALLAILLAGCAAKKAEHIYTWDNYQDALYQYYTTATSPQEQISTLNQVVEKARASGKQIPPGLHAQLGLLYSNTGQMELAIAEFNAEKTQFPESAAYIDFLTSNNKGIAK